METGNADKLDGSKLGENCFSMLMDHSPLIFPSPRPKFTPRAPLRPNGWHPWEGRAQAKEIRVPQGKPKLPLPAWKVTKHHAMRGTMPWDSHPILLVLVPPMDPLPGAVCKAAGGTRGSDELRWWWERRLSRESHHRGPPTGRPACPHH